MENRPDIWPTMVLLAGSFGLGCWRPSAGLFAFATAMPLPLASTFLFPGVQLAPSLVFSALSLGVGLRQW